MQRRQQRRLDGPPPAAGEQPPSSASGAGPTAARERVLDDDSPMLMEILAFLTPLELITKAAAVSAGLARPDRGTEVSVQKEREGR